MGTRMMQGRCQLLLADVLDNRHILGEWPLKDVKHGRCVILQEYFFCTVSMEGPASAVCAVMLPKFLAC